MIKWIKRVFLSILLLTLLLMALFFIIKPQAFYTMNWIIGSQIQWFGYDVKGAKMIENSLENLNYINGQTYHVISVQNTKNGNYGQAIEYLEKAVELSPEKFSGYYGWVLLYYYRDYERALIHLNKYDLLTPNFVDYVGDNNILYAKGLCYKQLGDYEKAEKLFTKAIENELKEYDEDWISHQLYFQKARVLHLLGENEKAIEYYDNAIRLWNGGSESFYYKGLALIERNDKSEGCGNLRLALDKIKNGLKSSDSYVSLFDEVYEIQIEDSFKKLCGE